MKMTSFYQFERQVRSLSLPVACLILGLTTASLFAQQETPQSTPTVENARVMQGMALTPRAFRAAADRIAPSLVTIESFGGTSTTAGKIGGIRQRGEGNTTGVMISPDGYIVTSSFNFIEQPPVITVITSDGVRRVAKLLGQDDTRKICLLKIQEELSDMAIPETISPDEIQVGQWAVSVGVGYGDKNPALSMGIISAKGRIAGRAIQTDANISPANYGGPLIDIEGKMIGICVPLAPGSADLGAGVNWYDSGIGFAIPLHNADKLIERLKEGKHIRRAFLGIRSEDVGDDKGIKVIEVIADSAAKKADIKKGDIVTAIDDHSIASVVELRKILTDYIAGDEITVKLTRKKKDLSVTLELGAPPKPEDEDTPSQFRGRRRNPGQPGR